MKRFSRSILEELIPTPEPLVAGDTNNLVVDYAYDYKRPTSNPNVGLTGAYTSEYGYGVNSRGGYGGGKGHGGLKTFTSFVRNES